jgi:hypothetical protein
MRLQLKQKRRYIKKHKNGATTVKKKIIANNSNKLCKNESILEFIFFILSSI